MIAAEEKEKQEQTAELHQEVYASELAGYLQAAYLTPEEQEVGDPKSPGCSDCG